MAHSLRIRLARAVEYHRTRRALARMPLRTARDLGLDPADARTTAARFVYAS